MTYEEFKQKYNGQYVDVDSFPKDWPYQCFDLAQLYFTEVLGLPSSVLAGCGVVKNMLYSPKRELMDKYFDEVSTQAMLPGDVCIWDFGEAGHIAMFDHWDGACWFFSQNPNPSQVMICDLPNLHAFRLKDTKEQLAEPTKRDETKNQVEVKVDNLRVRAYHSLDGDVLGIAKPGFYDYYETAKDDTYTWYRITDDWRRQWIASNGEWAIDYPAKKDKYVKFKILSEKDGYIQIDLGKVWIKE